MHMGHCIWQQQIACVVWHRLLFGCTSHARPSVVFHRVVEIVYQDGKWQSVEGMSTLTSPVTLGTSKDGYSGLWSTPSRLHSRLHSSLGLSNLGSTFSGIRPLPEPGMSTPTLTYSRKFDVSEI